MIWVFSSQKKKIKCSTSVNCCVKLNYFVGFYLFMHRFVRGLVSNVHLASLHMSSPKFFSPVNSQNEMLVHISTISGDSGHEHEGEGGADHNGSLCSWHGGECIELLLLLIQGDSGQWMPNSYWQFYCMGGCSYG